MAGKGKPGPRELLANPEVRKLLLDALRLGATHGIACKYAGISESGFYRMLALGRAGELPWASFSAEIDAAEAGGAVRNLAIIERAAAEGVWQAAAWKLERRYPREYGRSIDRDITEGATTASTTEARRKKIEEILLQARQRVISGNGTVN